ncbi:MAG: hypothetical protein ABI779_18175 [Acidobacteriota bacterium]
MDFLAWNNAIAAHFFRPEYAGKTVYLYVTPSVIEEIGGQGSVQAFVDAMKAGPDWASRSGLCQKALQSMHRWRERSLEFPPYIGYLALFVLAAGIEADFSQQAYYPRLRMVLGETPTIGTYPSFERMLELWSDLEEWLNHERSGELGILRTDIAGGWLHVGLPTAQSVLTESERERLHEIFADGGLDPEFPPSDLELVRTVRAGGSGALRPRTLRALESAQSEYGAVLIDRILEELESWDGTTRAALAENATGIRLGIAILCLTSIDEVSHRVRMELRCRFPEPFPEDVTFRHLDEFYRCVEGADGYSTAFVDASSQRFNPATLDWNRTTVLRGSTATVGVRWQGAPIRVFADASERGLPGFVEVPSLDPSRKFILAASPSVVAAVQEWGMRSCADFRELGLSGGPTGYRFFAASRAFDDELIRQQAPRLSFSKQLRRIRVIGGIHVPGMQGYFRFAPPSIRLDGGTEDDTVAMNGVVVRRDPGGTFDIPEELLAESIIVVTAGNLKRIIYLQDGGSVPEWPLRRYTDDGSSAPATTETLACGVEDSAATPALTPDPLPTIPAGVRAFVIGQRAGEITTSTEALPFDPVWLVFQRGRDEYHVRYVAANILEPLGGGRRGSTTSKELRAWKELLWHHRKRIAVPGFEPLRRLWQKYQDAAEHA